MNINLSSDPATFNPYKLNITNWIESMKNLGAKHGVLTAKHGCGFLLWPTRVSLPDGSPYGYDVSNTCFQDRSHHMKNDKSKTNIA